MTGLALLSAVEDGPEPADVKAGWTAFAVFLLLCAAVAFLGFSLVKQLRKAQAAKDAGVYGDEPVDRAAQARARAEAEAEAADGTAQSGPDGSDEPPRG